MSTHNLQSVPPLSWDHGCSCMVRDLSLKVQHTHFGCCCCGLQTLEIGIDEYLELIKLYHKLNERLKGWVPPCSGEPEYKVGVENHTLRDSGQWRASMYGSTYHMCVFLRHFPAHIVGWDLPLNGLSCSCQQAFVLSRTAMPQRETLGDLDPDACLSLCCHDL